MKRVAYHNLGCKVNSYELDVMKELLSRKGYETVAFDEEADIYIVNTCTVTNIADRKSRQILHRAKRKNPKAIVIAVGCYVETDREKASADPAIDLAIGNNKKGNIVGILEEYLQGRKITEEETREDLSARPSYESMQLTVPGHTRAFIKIQDGCSQFCSYCIIPYARGRIRSRENEDILREVRGLAREGIREVVLTGIHISSFGLEKGAEGPVRFDPVRGGENLIGLLQKIEEIDGIERIRLGSLEPRIITENFVRKMVELPKVCPHFHLSLQSGCNRTLRRMNRHYTAEEYFQGVETLRNYYDRPAITTDVIVGFPDETAEDFEESRAFLEKVNFYEIHVFKYSRRHGTAADRMSGQLTQAEKAERSDILLEMTKAQSKTYRRTFEGQEEEILLEECVTLGEREYMSGHTMRYVQGLVPKDTAPSGTIVRGRFRTLIPGTEYLAMTPEMLY